jgi:hypothetical protein
MTRDNRRENIHAELERAAEALKAADLLFENGYVGDAVSRLYYVVLYHVRAILLSEALESRVTKEPFAFSACISSGKIYWKKDSPRFSRNS